MIQLRNHLLKSFDRSLCCHYLSSGGCALGVEAGYILPSFVQQLLLLGLLAQTFRPLDVKLTHLILCQAVEHNSGLISIHS
jgi:hypothetical protein